MTFSQHRRHISHSFILLLMLYCHRGLRKKERKKNTLYDDLIQLLFPVFFVFCSLVAVLSILCRQSISCVSFISILRNGFAVAASFHHERDWMR